MAWWQWIAFGFLGLVLELVFPTGFFLLMLGVAGLIVGAVAYTGLLLDPAMQWILFAVLAVAFAVLFAKRLQKLLQREGSQDSTSAIGAMVEIKSIITPGNVGEGELWGSTWRIRNSGTAILEPGARRKVIAMEGVTLEVRDE